MLRKRFEYRSDIYLKAKQLRQEQTDSEKLFWKKYLKQSPFNTYTWNRQKPIHTFIADFYCSKLKLIIEIDGPIHEQSQDYDNARTHYLSQLGLTVIRFTNDEISKGDTKIYTILSNHISSVYGHSPKAN